jgi:hypothetical protein
VDEKAQLDVALQRRLGEVCRRHEHPFFVGHDGLGVKDP